MSKMWLVQAEHWSVPGQHMRLFASEEGAEAFALKEANGLIVEMGRQAQPTLKQALELLDGISAVEEYEAAVWITELEVNP